GQLRERKKLSYLKEEASCNSYGSKELEMSKNGEGLKLWWRLGQGREKHGQAREGE
ncbi:hypothetical protein A2U01_0071031, partial [Trifolium medium]|nr:hypothetical protein [Trifolium medium]